MSLLDAFSLIEIPAIEGGSEVISIASAQSLLLAKHSATSPLLVVTASSRRAEDLAQELRAYLGYNQVVEFPPWETLPHEKLSPKSDTITARFAALHRLNSKSVPRIVVTSARGLLQPIIADLLDEELITLTKNQSLEMNSLLERLSYFGYTRTDLVEKRGDFAVRGGIVDLFPADQEHPIRIDYFGDEIDDLSYFAVADQRSLSTINDAITIYPCRELLISESVAQKAGYIAAEFPSLNEICNKIANHISVDGMESLASLLKPDMKSLLHFLPAGFSLALIDAPRIRSRALDLVATNMEFLEASWSNAAIGGTAPINIDDEIRSSGYYTLDEIREDAAANDISISSFNLYQSESDLDESGLVIDELQPIPVYGGKIESAIADIQGWRAQEYQITFTASGPGLLERYQDLFRESDITGISLALSGIAHGFISDSSKVALITERDISGQRSSGKDQGRMPSRRKKAIDPLQLTPGDYVVHEQHGVGRYVELVARTVSGVSREYLVIEYASSKRGQPADRLFVPTDTLEQVTKYVGGEAPAVHRIGGADWQNAKRRARKAVKQIAAELIQLYAARMSAPGFAFSPDTAWQRELEAAFPYVETIDQQATIDEVKRDMEQSHPMDRIVCGDVGYGKTEIAIRAAFKAVQDGKQVAVLVPTTLLVQQHLTTFNNRYSGFPIKVAGLSRFNTAKEGKAILEGITDGSLDVVIGTHRLLSKDVQFKDLGLVIVDEEQRFGVEHKEELKKTRTNVDVLSMSATPIPRTLEMAITGIREMSNITTPPEERHPVLTYVGPYDDRQVTAAIHRELLRDGQIFFIHNRVDSIDDAVIRLKKLVPEARIRIAHGQMGERELEDVILGFWERDFDILVCTTIVESGIDIPNANTLIVDRAENFGLSQLHQLRGRVGRSRERAYAYFLYSPDKPLTEVAHDRLATIATNTDLGSGMQVAMKDLEIRGAGNLLGGEQSGHIAEVGFDLYMRMVGEAVEDYKTGYIDETPKIKECKVELPVTAHLPVEYVPSERLRLDIYRRMADAHDDHTLEEIRAELVDRFGELPEAATNLMAVAHLRSLAISFGLTEVVLQG